MELTVTSRRRGYVGAMLQRAAVELLRNEPIGAYVIRKDPTADKVFEMATGFLYIVAKAPDYVETSQTYWDGSEKSNLKNGIITVKVSTEPDRRRYYTFDPVKAHVFKDFNDFLSNAWYLLPVTPARMTQARANRSAVRHAFPDYYTYMNLNPYRDEDGTIKSYGIAYGPATLAAPTLQQLSASRIRKNINATRDRNAAKRNVLSRLPARLVANIDS